MEDNAFIVHTSTVTNPLKWEECTIIWRNSLGGSPIGATYYYNEIYCDLIAKYAVFMILKVSKNAAGENGSNIRISDVNTLYDIFDTVEVDTSSPNFDIVTCTANRTNMEVTSISLLSNVNNTQKIQLTKFPLSNIDVMRENILQAPTSSAFEINSNAIAPY